MGLHLYPSGMLVLELESFNCLSGSMQTFPRLDVIVVKHQNSDLMLTILPEFNYHKSPQSLLSLSRMSNIPKMSMLSKMPKMSKKPYMSIMSRMSIMSKMPMITLKYSYSGRTAKC
jgi:hypothetical protein